MRLASRSSHSSYGVCGSVFSCLWGGPPSSPPSGKAPRSPVLGVQGRIMNSDSFHLFHLRRCGTLGSTRAEGRCHSPILILPSVPSSGRACLAAPPPTPTSSEVTADHRKRMAGDRCPSVVFILHLRTDSLACLKQF